MSAAVYVQTNDADRNEVIAFSRSDDGVLGLLGRYDTGGRGTGQPHLSSQNSVVLSDDGRWLLVVNAGSEGVQLFAADGDGLQLTYRVGSGGSSPTSVAVSGSLAYVLNNGSASIVGFTIGHYRLDGHDGFSRPLSAEGAY